MFKCILTVLILFFSSYAFSNESDLTISQQLERLQREVSDLSKEVFSNSANQSNGTNNDFVKNLSAIDLRIYDIENDIKNLTSNLEELYFQLDLSLIHISEPTRRTPISYAVFCLKKIKLKE